MLENDRKVPVDQIKPVYLTVDSASCYPVKATDNTIFYAGQLNQDKNILKVKLVKTQFKTQLELVLIGDYHKETLTYNKTQDWKSWARIDIPIKDLDKLIKHLQTIQEAIK